MKLRCPVDQEHKRFIAVAMVPEEWLLNEDGDCEDAWEASGCAIDCDVTRARCQECDAAVIVEE